MFSIRTKLSYTKKFSGNFLATELKRAQILVNKPVYLGLPILEISKLIMYEFWYDYVKPEYGEKANYVTWMQAPL